MKLSNFENSIDATILMRGKGYYESSHIESLEEISKGEWQAQVEGTDLYQIDVVLSENNTIVDHYCDCPFDGYYCKHEVAVFFALEAMQITQQGKSTKRLTIKKKIELVLEKLSKEELQEYLQNTVLNNKKERDYFLLHFDYLLGEAATPDKYQKIVQGIINNHSDYGFIDYRATSAICSELDSLLDQARMSLKNNPQQAFIISRVVIEAIPAMAETMDDSNGESSWVLETAIEIILDYLQQADEEFSERAFQWCMKIYLNDDYSDYGYDDVDRLFDYFCTADSIYKNQILNVLDKKISSTDEYDLSRRLFTKADLLALWGDHTSSRSIIMDNLDEPEFRQILVDENLKADKPVEAIKLINQGIKVAEQKSHSGVVSSWQKQLLEIAKQQKDKDEIARLAGMLLINDFSMDYYRLFKKTSKDWVNDYQALVNKFEGYDNNLAQIYSEEDEYKSLFLLIKNGFEKERGYRYHYSRLGLLERYLDELILYYPDEILSLYREDIYQRAENTGRNIYEDIAKDLNKMKKLQGGQELVEDIVTDFQKKYKNRPAMQEILAGI